MIDGDDLRHSAVRRWRDNNVDAAGFPSYRHACVRANVRCSRPECGAKARRHRGNGRSGYRRRSLRYSGLAAARKLVDYTTKHYVSVDTDDVKVLRRRLLQAGIYSPHAAAYFFLARAGMAVGGALAAALVLSMFGQGVKTSFWLVVVIAAVFGYLAPTFYLNRRVAGRRLEHQAGFPDFMDIMVVCADAGLAMEAALERVAREQEICIARWQPTSILQTSKSALGARLLKRLDIWPIGWA